MTNGTTKILSMQTGKTCRSLCRRELPPVSRGPSVVRSSVNAVAESEICAVVARTAAHVFRERPFNSLRCAGLREPFTRCNDSRALGYLKLCTKLEMVRLQPSTNTNSKSLKGNEIMAGGNMNMPMLISTDATTVSMMMKGR